MALGPTRKPDRQRVVVVFDDGTRLKGLVDGFRPERARFVLREVDLGGQVVRTHDVDVHQVLAAFFVHDLALWQDSPVQAPPRRDRREPAVPPGRPVRVTFVWGETLEGRVVDRDARRRWLVIEPVGESERSANIDRIFVTRRAIAAMRALS
ncbi:MAG TPA: hypothetical protein VM778_05115 [Gemmatimonadota bacterium]|nr:hypothetical protein [Gemmatimonadota bacterium]